MPRILTPGDPVPAFRGKTLLGNPEFHFSSAAGRPTILLFLGSGDWPSSREPLRTLKANIGLFDDNNACFFGVSINPTDVSENRIAQRTPGVRWFLDYDGEISKACGAISSDGRLSYHPHWLLLDQMQRVVERAAIDQGEEILTALRRHLDSKHEPNVAPILLAPRIFDQSLCRRLIQNFEAHGGEDSGFMREEDGMTVGKIDHSFKRRRDYHLPDGEIKQEVMSRLYRFLKPLMMTAFSFEATRVERWLIARYSNDDGGGYFRPHRDNTTKGTAHRRFACTINLNTEEYEGGDLRFPEFGKRSYRAPTGGALVFSCSLLHEALPVVQGTRYAFLPFFYDEEGSNIRNRNLEFVSPEHRATI